MSMIRNISSCQLLDRIHFDQKIYQNTMFKRIKHNKFQARISHN